MSIRAASFVTCGALLCLGACGTDDPLTPDSDAGTSSSSSSGSSSSSTSSSGHVTDASTDAAADASSERRIQWGVNGHELRPSYPLGQSEAVFQLLHDRGLHTYRVDVTAQSAPDVLDVLVPLGKTYGVIVRPMLYPTDTATAKTLALRYGLDVPIWEIGNEVDYQREGAEDRVATLAATAQGIDAAATESGLDIATSINVMACNTDDVSPTGRCPGATDGDMWFLDLAVSAGFHFDYVTFHYYPSFGDKGYWFDMFLGQMRAYYNKFGTPILYNELNCAEVYERNGPGSGNVDGGHPGDQGCYDSLVDVFAELQTKYADIVQEVDMYELIDEPNNDGDEAHFGLVYDLATPKPTLDLVTQQAAN